MGSARSVIEVDYSPRRTSISGPISGWCPIRRDILVWDCVAFTLRKLSKMCLAISWNSSAFTFREKWRQRNRSGERDKLTARNLPFRVPHCRGLFLIRDCFVYFSSWAISTLFQTVYMFCLRNRGYLEWDFICGKILRNKSEVFC